MSKNKTRLIIVITAIVTIISTFCYAETGTNQVDTPSAGDMARTTTTTVEDESTPVTTAEDGSTAVTTSEDEHIHEETTEVEEETVDSVSPQVHEGDLYLFDSDITMDKLVDGNVFIFGNNITITGQCSGNMFVFGNNITFDKSYIQSSVFVCGNDVKFNAVSSSLYCASKNLSIENQFGVYLDLYATCSTFDFSGLIGRNAFLTANTINLGDTATFYGDLNYSSGSELEIPEGLVQGEIKYSEIAESSKPTIASYISDLVQTLILAIVSFFIVKLFTKDPECKECSVLSHPFKTFGTGLLSIIIIPVALLILAFSIVGAYTSIIGLGLYSSLYLIATLILPISLARYLCIGKAHKGIKQFLYAVIISVILWALSLIPYVGVVIYLLTIIMGFGIVIYTPLKKKSRCSSKNDKKLENTKDESPTEDSKKSDKEIKKDDEQSENQSDNK